MVTERKTSGELLEAEAQRVRISRLLIIALLRERPMLPNEFNEKLVKAADLLSEKNPKFFLDFGWRESALSIAHSLTNLNWLTAASKHDYYAPTVIGVSHLDDAEKEIKETFGLTWSEIAKKAFEAKSEVPSDLRQWL